jgi:hypothetical protein
MSGMTPADRADKTDTARGLSHRGRARMAGIHANRTKTTDTAFPAMIGPEASGDPSVMGPAMVKSYAWPSLGIKCAIFRLNCKRDRYLEKLNNHFCLGHFASVASMFSGLK